MSFEVERVLHRSKVPFRLSSQGKEVSSRESALKLGLFAKLSLFSELHSSSSYTNIKISSKVNIFTKKIYSSHLSFCSWACFIFL